MEIKWKTIAISLVVLCLSFYFVRMLKETFDAKKVPISFRITVTNLNDIRLELKRYNEANNKYPENLDELRKYCEPLIKKGDITREIDWKEYMSTEEGNNNESGVLNNQGGWFYNRETGEIKINITTPYEFKMNDSTNPSDW